MQNSESLRSNAKKYVAYCLKNHFAPLKMMMTELLVITAELLKTMRTKQLVVTAAPLKMMMTELLVITAELLKTMRTKHLVVTAAPLKMTMTERHVTTVIP